MTPFTSAEDLFRREGSLEEKIASLLAERDQLQADLAAANDLADGMQVSRPADPPSPRAAEGALTDDVLAGARKVLAFAAEGSFAIVLNRPQPDGGAYNMLEFPGLIVDALNLTLAQAAELATLRETTMQAETGRDYQLRRSFELLKQAEGAEARATAAESALAERDAVKGGAGGGAGGI